MTIEGMEHPDDDEAPDYAALAREMAEALRPFADYPDAMTASWRDDAEVTGFTLGDVRRAKAALAKARAAGLLP